MGATFPLDGHGSYLFGRSKEASTKVRDSRMSRTHAWVRTSADGYLVEDLDTTNGTFLDARAVIGRHPLTGSILSMGDTLFVVDRPPDRDRIPYAPDADPMSVRGEIQGSSLSTTALRAWVATAAPKPGPVLLLGQTGVGKEVAARAIHKTSQRHGEFVAVNCAAVPMNLAESLFFGHTKHAFTGAERAQDGYFQRAMKGTLFLDEVGELPLDLQAKLLRVLEDHQVHPVGAGRAQTVDVRIVAATNADLESNGFRPDLRARLSEWVVHIPPLAERKADILDLWRWFSKSPSPDQPSRISAPEFCEALLLHDWPTNARGLRTLARTLDGLVGDGPEFLLEHLDKHLQEPLLPRFEEGESGRRREGATKPLIARSRQEDCRDDDSLDDERSVDDAADSRTPPNCEALKQALIDAKGNVKLAAKRNHWHRTQLYRWLRRCGIDPGQYR